MLRRVATLGAMTARLPFDPSKMKGSPPASSPPPPAPASDAREAARPISVADLASLISGSLDTLPRGLRVVGEVSGFRDRTHWYFDLKDDRAIVNCVMFASAARRAGFTLANGQSVVATGRVEFYAKGGKVSFMCERLEPVGAGALDLAFRRLVEEIRVLGWFDPARKRPLPAFPRRIGVVTSRTGAALQDVIDTARRRCPAVDLLVVDVRVQGEHAAPEIAGAIAWLGAHHVQLGIDAVLVTRGGGSAEDLWAFNEKVVAGAIVACPIPVVAAIGHETDTTIAELVADERCATPTQAATRLIPDRAALGEQLDALAGQLRSIVDRRLSEASRRVDQVGRLASSSSRLLLAGARSRVDQLATRLEQQRPAAAQARRQARLDEAHRRLVAAARAALMVHDPDAIRLALSNAIHRRVRREVDRAGALERTLAAVGPLRVLARGYSVTTRGDGRVVRAPSDVRPGEALLTRLADGEVRSTVDGHVQAAPASMAAAGPVPARTIKPGARRPVTPPPSTTDPLPGLFG